MKIRFLTIIFALASISTYSQNINDANSDDFLNIIKDNVSKFENYAYSYPIEKVHLHVDRNLYFPGDNIWFKAYLAEGVFHHQDTISEILYVDLISPQNKLIVQHKLKIEESHCHGDFKLAPNLATGNYIIQAYTSWMKNWGEDNVFAKRIVVRNPNNEPKNISLDYKFLTSEDGDQLQLLFQLPPAELEKADNERYGYSVLDENGGIIIRGINNFDDNDFLNVSIDLDKNIIPKKIKVNLRNSVDNTVYTNEISLNNVLNASFFPEGGYLLNELESKVAFKVVNQNGEAENVTGCLFNAAGEELIKFSTIYGGMGYFNFTPKANQDYYVVLNEKNRFELPKPLNAGYLLKVSESDVDNFYVNVFGKGISNNKYCTLIGQTRGKIYYVTNIKLENGQSQFLISKSHFPEGIVQFTLFDQQGIPYCERLTYNRNNISDLKIQLLADKNTYSPREKVRLKIKTEDPFGFPVQANLSLAVCDYYQYNANDSLNGDILTSFYLTSELKGAIENPSYYLNHQNQNSKQALDLLLMTHGWRRFSWQQVLSESLLDISYPIERAFTFTWKITDYPMNYPVEDNELSFMYSVEGKDYIEKAYPNRDSSFNLILNPFYDTVQFIVQTKSNKGKSKDITLKINTYDFQFPNFLSVLQNNKIDNWEKYNKLYKEKEFINRFYSDIRHEKLDEVVVSFNRKIAKLPKDPLLLSIDLNRGVFLEDEKVYFENALLYLRKIPGVHVSQAAPGRYCAKIGANNSFHMGNQPRYYIDGMLIPHSPFDPCYVMDVIASIPPDDVYYINVVKHAEAGILGANGANGAVLIYTKSGSGIPIEVKRDEGIYVYRIPGFYTAREFYSPFYNDRVKNDTKRDIRPTIYWNPNIQTDKNGEAFVEFYNSDRITQIDAYIEGMCKTGIIGKTKTSYFVEMNTD